MSKKFILLPIVIGVLSCYFAAVLFADVIVTPWGGPNVSTFPADDPPTDPPLGDDGDADATPKVGWSGGEVGRKPPPKPGVFVVGSLGDITVGGRTDIREPNNCSDKLHDHEIGHDTLNEYEYNQRAKEKIEKAFEGFVGSEFVGEGDTPEARDANAMAQVADERDKRANRAVAAILQQMDELGSKYDDVTDHGQKDDPNTNEGVAKAEEEREKALQAGTVVSDSNSDSNSTSNSIIPVGSDGQYMVFWGPAPITHTGNPYDPLLGRGQVSVGSIIPIGLQDNRTILLSDTHVDINDPITGETLLKGYVFEAAYMESSRPGYAGMIQGYLDIPPEWAGGTNNIIGSPFLASIQTACDSNEQTTFWYFAHQPLFDEKGKCIIGPGGVGGEVVFGVAIPVNRTTVEDFESYVNPADLWDKWTLHGNAMGYLVEGEPPEHIKSGERAMSIIYDTSTPPCFGEAVCQFNSPQDWLSTGARELELWINDDQAGKVIGQMYVTLESFNGMSYRYELLGDTSAIMGVGPVEAENWWSVNIDLQEFEGNGVELSEIRKLIIGFGDGVNPGGSGAVFVDDIILYKSRRHAKLAGDLNLDDMVDFKDIAILAEDWLGTGIWPEPHQPAEP